jgi:hypothetical protein
VLRAAGTAPFSFGGGRAERHPPARCQKEKAWPALLGFAFRINGLVEIDPENAGQKCDRRREGQEQHDRPDCVCRDPPAGQPPQNRRNYRNHRQAQSVADIHCAQEVSRLSLKQQVADRAAIVHLGESAEYGMVKNVPGAATGTTLANNIAHCRELCGASHRQSIGRELYANRWWE